MDIRNYLIFISALTLFSCGKQYGTEPQDDFVNAEVISPSCTRVSTGNETGGKIPLMWEAGDRIRIFGTGSSAGSTYVTYDSGTKTAKFKYDETVRDNVRLHCGEIFTAMYPAEYLPSGRAVTFPGQITIPYPEKNNSHMPMLGYGGRKSMTFRYSAAAIRVRLYGLTKSIQMQELRIGARQDMSGEAGKIEDNGTITWSNTGNEDSIFGNIVRVRIGGDTDGNANESTDGNATGMAEITTNDTISLTVSVPPGEYSNLAFQIQDADGNWHSYSVPGSKTLAQGTLTSFTLPHEAFSSADGPIEKGRLFYPQITMEYKLTAAHDEDKHMISVESCREEKFADGRLLTTDIPWTTEFSIDEGQSFSKSVPSDIFGNFDISGTGISYTAAASAGTGSCIVRIRQAVSGKTQDIRISCSGQA